MATKQHQNPGSLTLPPGSVGVVLQDGEVTRTMVRATDALFSLWDYTPVHTPMADYVDSFAQSLDLRVPDHTYRFVDRDGHILSLRSDITLFLMKQIHHFLRGAQLPLRLCYSDSIFRHQDKIDIGKNEYFQTGAELFGVGGRDGDLEVLCLLAETLNQLGVNQPVLHLGSRKLFKMLWHQVQASTQEQIAQGISNRNWDIVQTLSQPHFGDTTPLAIQLMSIIGPWEEISSRLETSAVQELLALVPQVKTELNHVLDLAKTLTHFFPQLDVRIDLSELGSQSYHSGIAFQVYMDGTDSALASGGRYDGLLASMGLDIPAAGFSLMLSKLLALSHGSGTSFSAHSEKLPTTKTFEQRFTLATQARKAGRRVSL